MNKLTGEALIDLADLQRQIEARDREVANPFTKDMQLTAIRSARRYRGDKLIRDAKPHRFLDPAAGPLIAVRLHILTRKSLGGLQTNLTGPGPCPGPRLARADPRPVRGRGGSGVRRRRDARLPLAGRDLPRRLPVLRRQAGRAAARETAS